MSTSVQGNVRFPHSDTSKTTPTGIGPGPETFGPLKATPLKEFKLNLEFSMVKVQSSLSSLPRIRDVLSTRRKAASDIGRSGQEWTVQVTAVQSVSPFEVDPDLRGPTTRDLSGLPRPQDRIGGHAGLQLGLGALHQPTVAEFAI